MSAGWGGPKRRKHSVRVNRGDMAGTSQGRRGYIAGASELWNSPGSTLAFPWLHPGLPMALPWLPSGFTLGFLQLCLGFPLALPWLSSGFALAVPWPYPGFPPQLSSRFSATGQRLVQACRLCPLQDFHQNFYLSNFGPGSVQGQSRPISKSCHIQ